MDSNSTNDPSDNQLAVISDAELRRFTTGIELDGDAFLLLAPGYVPPTRPKGRIRLTVMGSECYDVK